MGFGEKKRVLQQPVFLHATRAPQPKENAANTGDVRWTGCTPFLWRGVWRVDADPFMVYFLPDESGEG